jgi:N-acetylornithine carbamoyltransferase
MTLKGKHFITTSDWSVEDLTGILDRAGTDQGKPLEGKSVGLLFFNPSLRTRVSFEVGIQQLGGNVVTLAMGRDVWKVETQDGVVMDQDKAEHVKDAVKVLGRYVDALAVRSFPGMENLDEDLKDHVIEQFRKYSDKPVINMESAMWHPCQAMADMLTIRQKCGGLKGKKVVLTWAYHPKALPTAVSNSFATAAEQFGCDLVVATPPGYDIPKGPAGTANLDEALDGADIVYAKSWGSLEYYGKWDEEKKIREQHRDWIVNEEKMAKTNNAFFMHCLPVRRNVVVSDGVIDGPQSAVYDQAENRLHVQKAVLEAIV